MATLQELNNRQINEAIAAAVDRSLPLTVTVQSGQSWVNLRSAALALRDGHLLIEHPWHEDRGAPWEFEAAQRIAVSFKLRHHKHLFNAVIAGCANVRLDDGAETAALSLCLPTRMQRLQRRAFFRSEVPANRIVRASFWAGGRSAEPRGTSQDRPVWSGGVCNISAGGFQLQTTPAAIEAVEIGETVGMRLAFGASSGETVYADAQLRHVEVDGDKAIMGFQFLGLAQTAEGERALQVISAKVAEFQRLAEEKSCATRSSQ